VLETGIGNTKAFGGEVWFEWCQKLPKLVGADEADYIRIGKPR
jgi:hypothetical protein